MCLYEDDIEKVKDILSQHFDIIDITDKTAQIEETDNSFGYKGLHLDLRLNNNRRDLPEYHKYSDFQFEVQVRTIIQDSWSVLDHKIKYKKSIPNKLKRRINTLAALFELADREFREIRDSTNEEIQKAESSTVEEIESEGREESTSEEVTSSLLEHDNSTRETSSFTYQPLNAFDFLKIAKHFFAEYEFEAYKVDGFVQEIIGFKSNITRGKFNFYMKKSISKVKLYNKELNEILNPFTVIRHCLYLGDKEIFGDILTNSARENFEEWLNLNT